MDFPWIETGLALVAAAAAGACLGQYAMERITDLGRIQSALDRIARRLDRLEKHGVPIDVQVSHTTVRGPRTPADVGLVP